MSTKKKKIQDPPHFLEFLRDYYRLDNPTMYHRLEWDRQRYFQAIKNNVNYSLTSEAIEDLAERFRVPLKNMQKCVHQYLFRSE